MARARTVAVLMNLVRIYDRQVVHGIARYVRTGVDWQVHFKEDPSDEIVSFSRCSANGVIVDLDDVRLGRVGLEERCRSGPIALTGRRVAPNAPEGEATNANAVSASPFPHFGLATSFTTTRGYNSSCDVLFCPYCC